MDDKGRELCPRLIDYLVIVGRRSRSKCFSQPSFDGASSQTVTAPELLRRYPTDNHKDFNLPTDVTVFCQPEGCTIKGISRNSQSFCDEYSFVFTLTEKDSAKIRHGICLNFFQRFERNRPATEGSIASESLKFKRNIQRLSLTSLCLISHHPFLLIFRELLLVLKKLIDSCCERVQVDGKSAKDAIWSALTGQCGESIPSSVMSEIRELETWILMILSAPVPVPGKTKVQLEVMPLEIMPMFEFALPDHTRFSLIDFPLHLPLEILGTDMAVKVLTAVMLECKVLLQSRNYNAVSMCVLAIVSLLYPLEYMFPVIPLLPSYMLSAEQLLFAPTPFIIGIPASFFSQKNIDTIPNDVILVDLDSNQMTIPDGVSVPEMPEPDCSILKANFRAALGKLKLPPSDLDVKLRDEPETLSGSMIDSDQVDIAARVAMIRFFNGPNVFANFSEHTRTLRLYPRPVVALQTESFLRSRPQITQFILDLCRTQAVEYFAESCLCPKNETYVRVQTGIDNPEQIGDKGKWFSESLMPVHFAAYPSESTLADAWHKLEANAQTSLSKSSESEDENGSDDYSYSSIDDLVFESPDELNISLEASKPLGEVDDVYREPLTLELPRNESALSVGSSFDSERTSSSVSTSAMDSEADFARLAENLALKADAKGDLTFDHQDVNTPVQSRNISQIMINQESDNITPTGRAPQLKFSKMKGIAHLTDSGERVLGPQLMNALNGYAERSHDMFNQMLNRTAPKAQALRDKTVRPIAVAAANRMEQSQYLVKTKTSTLTNNSNTATQQSRNQQIVRDICDQVLSGQGIGVFTYPKLRRLMEDENLRDLVCSKLNLGLEIKLSEDDNVQEMQLTRSQYKGYVKVLQTCISGLECSFNKPGSTGLASVFHVLGIAHTHYWSNEAEASTPISATCSQINTPSSVDVEQEIVQDSSIYGSGLPTLPNQDAQDGQRKSEQKRVREIHGILLPGGPPPPLPPRPKKSQTEIDPIEIFCGSASLSDSSPSAVSMSSIRSNSDYKEKNVPEIAGKLNLSPQVQRQARIDEQPEPPRTLPLPSNPVSTSIKSPDCIRHYIYQDLILASQNPLWQKMSFWENAFFDIVAQERDIIGMDQEPSEMLDRYGSLSESEKRRLELDEDRLLATLLHNLTAYMIMCGTGQKAIQQKIRRLLGKAHIGLVYSKTINQLLDNLPLTQGNGIPLKPLGSRLVQKQSFTVYSGSDTRGSMMFLEVCDDAVVLRAINGAITERWWYERLVNMTYSPKTRVLCLWRRHEGKVHMHKFYTKKCRELYSHMKAAMERAAARGKVSMTGRDLGGEFPVHDTASNEGGLLQIRIDGIAILFADRQHFIELSNIKKCNTFGGNVFILEEYDRKKNELVQRRYMSQMADQICYAVLCVFSFAAAARTQENVKKQVSKPTRPPFPRVISQVK